MTSELRIKKSKYYVIGLMSGTSLDGLDIAYCEFNKKGKTWSYKIVNAETVPYHKEGKNKLQNAHLLKTEELCELHTDFGIYIGEKVLQFIKKHKIKKVDLISSHGHTVFHQPQNHFTYQLGDGASIAAVTGVKTVCDFRSMDVALGGQGAPLVPIGDELLFNKYDACLNIGGIANISFKQNGTRLAFDICPANMLFNYLAKQKKLEYDKGGKLAASGNFNNELLKKFNSISYYKNYKSKSLGREDIEENFISLLNPPSKGAVTRGVTGDSLNPPFKGAVRSKRAGDSPLEGGPRQRRAGDVLSNLSIADQLATVSEHAAFQTARVLNNFKIKNVLVTGGGAYNTDFLNRVSAYSDCTLHIPDDRTIQFKEALIFAFLGVLRIRNEVNALKEVTGAKRDSSGGALYG